MMCMQRAVIMWMPDPATRDANIVRHALEGDVDLKAATEVICSRTPSQMRQFKQIYFSSFDVDLEDDLATKLSSGDHKKVTLQYFVYQIFQYITSPKKKKKKN